MDTGVWLALAAALLAAASLGWQLGAALGRRRRERIEVEVRLGLPVYSQGGGRWAIFIEVTNGSEHPIRWVSASLELGDSRMLYLMDHPPGGDLPAVIQPHDSHHTWVDCAEVERQGVDLRQPIARRGQDGVWRGLPLALPAAGRQARPDAGLAVVPNDWS